MKLRIIIFLILTLTCSSKALSQDDLIYGLYFSSHEVIQDKRTSLNLTPNSFFKIANNFSIEFEANFRQDDGYYGYIFRLLGEDETNIDFVSNLASSTLNFWLVYKEQTLVSFKWEQLPGVSYDEWVKIKFDIDITTSQISLSINDIKQKTTLPESFQTDFFNLVFGASHYQNFISMDVCPMSIRDIRIFNNNELHRYWKLAKHINNKVYDEVEKAEAIVSNPIWIIDRYVKWRKIKEFQVNGLIGSTHDELNRRVFFLNNNNLYSVNIGSLMIDTIPYLKNKPYEDVYARQIIYNKYLDELWSYDFDSDAINVFDFKTQAWSESPTHPIESLHAHQNRFISPIDSSLIAILGYGQYNYSSDVHHYNRRLKSWERINRSNQIGSRYLSGSTLIADDKALVFGGFGSSTGQQELSPKFYYDLYYFDLNDFSFQKISTLPNPITPFVPSESLVFDEQSNSFYTLIYNNMQYNTHLQLARFNISDDEFVLYDDSIPYNFLDIESWNNIFLDKINSELIAYTTTDSKVEIYSIAYPPILKQDVLQELSKKRSLISCFLWVLITLISISVALFLLKKRRKSIDNLEQKENQPTTVLQNRDLGKPINRDKPSSIYLLGDFKIIDDDKVDITSDFAPTTSQLFLLILMTTIKNGKGTTSEELKNVLWFDKEDNSARNNRNVYISKLRSILKSFAKLDIVNEGGWQNIEGLDNVTCDYIRCQTLMKMLINNKVFNKDILIELVDLALFGKLLPNMQYEWLEPYQTKYTNSLINLILQFKEIKEVKNDLNLLLKMANVILLHDNIDEDAISLKCYSLYNMGRKKQALLVFNKFLNDYEDLLKEKSKLAFDDLIKQC